MEAIRDRETKRHDLARTLAAVETPMRAFDAKTIERTVRTKLENWRRLLTRQVQDGRQLLREALAGPLRFTAEQGRYSFEGEVPIDRILRGSTRNDTIPRSAATNGLAVSGIVAGQ